MYQFCYGTMMVLPEGFEPSLDRLSTCFLYQLGYGSEMVRAAGVEPTMPVPRTGVLPGYTTL